MQSGKKNYHSWLFKRRVEEVLREIPILLPEFSQKATEHLSTPKTDSVRKRDVDFSARLTSNHETPRAVNGGLSG
ncbi:hypothetical protein D3C75_1189610 [compost metagenome]